jgi:hypothetical protein
MRSKTADGINPKSKENYLGQIGVWPGRRHFGGYRPFLE